MAVILSTHLEIRLEFETCWEKLKNKTAKSENQGKGRELFYVHRSTNNLQFNFVGLASFCMSIATTNFVLHIVSELCACVFSNFSK